MKKLIAMALVLAACAQADEVESVEEHTQAATVAPWYPGQSFNEVYRGGNYYTATTPNSFWYALTTGETWFERSGTVQSGDDTSYYIGSVDWSLHFWGGANGCVLYGCTFYLCLNNDGYGWGTCAQVLGQGTNSSTMTLYGSTSHFAGIRHRPFETLRWTMGIQTGYSGTWYPTYIDDFTVTAYKQ